MSLKAELDQRKRRLFSKAYLPGYTGHVPTKNDFFGMTAGEVNKTILYTGGIEIPQATISKNSTHSIGFYPSTPSKRGGKNLPPTDIYGNHSRLAPNWIAGPTHELCLQHIPGYKGHVPGVVSENLFCKSYAKCT